QVARCLADERAHGDRLTQTERPELVVARVVRVAVHLVDGEDDGAIRRAEQLGDALIHRVRSDLPVDDEHDDVRLVDGRLDLAPDGGGQAGFGVRFQPAGVHEEEAPPVPLRAREVAVARDAGHVLDNGPPLSQDAVEEGALADVRPADDRDRGECAAHSAANPAVSSCAGTSFAGATAAASCSRGMSSMKRSSSLSDSAGSSTASSAWPASARRMSSPASSPAVVTVSPK